MNRFVCKIILGIICLTFLAAPIQSWAASSTKSSISTVTSGKSWAQMTTVEKVQMISALSAGLLLFVAEVWFIVAGFKASVGWGLFMLFIGGMRSIGAAIAMIGWLIQWLLLTHQGKPLELPALILGGFVVFAGGGAIIFFIRHWKQARRPLAVMGLALVLLLVVVALQFAK